MATITLKGNETNTLGPLLKLGDQIPDFVLSKQNLEEVSFSSFKNKVLLCNIFPSLDTGVCATSIMNFEKHSAEYPQVQILHISKDLPFAQQRFCSQKEASNAMTLSAFRSSLGEKLGIEIQDGPLKGLLSRVVLLLDENLRILYVEQVSEITHEPNYEAVFEKLSEVKG